ncbi:MAG TPA: hypothetical protein VMD28_08185 [Acidimicrobiales bacterium]|nr:hypothetical protein [Acidimicrobiales bacterium]
MGGPFVRIHFIEGPAPSKLALPKTHEGGTSKGNEPVTEGICHGDLA